MFVLGFTIWLCAFGDSEGQLDKNHFEFGWFSKTIGGNCFSLIIFLVNSLNCTVKDERKGVVSDSPSYCWVFSKDTSGRRYAPKNEINCCWIVQQSNDRFGGDLSAIVEMQEDGM